MAGVNTYKAKTYTAKTVKTSTVKAPKKTYKTKNVNASTYKAQGYDPNTISFDGDSYRNALEKTYTSGANKIYEAGVGNAKNTQAQSLNDLLTSYNNSRLASDNQLTTAKTNYLNSLQDLNKQNFANQQALKERSSSAGLNNSGLKMALQQNAQNNTNSDRNQLNIAYAQQVDSIQKSITNLVNNYGLDVETANKIYNNTIASLDAQRQEAIAEGQGKALTESMSTQLGVDQFNVGEQNKASEFLANANNQAGQFNATQRQNANIYNADVYNNASKWLADTRCDASKTNAQFYNTTKQFNAGAINKARANNANAINNARQYNATAHNTKKRQDEQLANQRALASMTRSGGGGGYYSGGSGGSTDTTNNDVVYYAQMIKNAGLNSSDQSKATGWLRQLDNGKLSWDSAVAKLNSLINPRATYNQIQYYG